MSAAVPDHFQQRVIDATDRSIRVVAPAGSGKTETLARRVKARIDQGADPRRILVLTFDNNARLAFAGRLQALSVPGTVQVLTLNAFGYRLLRSTFRDERTEMMRGQFFPETDLLSELSLEHGNRVFTEMLGKIKNEAIDPRTMPQRDLALWASKNREHLLRNLEDDPIMDGVDDNRFGRDLAWEMRRYEEFLQERGWIDFDDQKLRPLIRLEADQSARERLQTGFDDVIVDEFQDINRLDAKLIKLISDRANLLITGDDDQAIYGFRGATAGFLINPKRTFSRSFSSYELAINYRCPKSILNVASTLIEHNPTRLAKSPRAAKRVPGEVSVIAAEDPEAEAKRIADHAFAQISTTTGPAPTVAVLTRRRNQLLGIQAAMIEAGVPFVVDTDLDLRITWSLALRSLRLGSQLRMHRIPEAEQREEIVRVFAGARLIPPARTNRLVQMTVADDSQFPGPELLQLLYEAERRDFTEGVRALFGEMPVVSRLNSLDQLLKATISTAVEGGRNAQDRPGSELSRLDGLIALAKRKRLGPEAFAEEIERMLAIQRGAWRDATIPRVDLSTCHGAKGREWQVVYLPHANHGVFPDARSLEGVHLESERKLFYVTMTRASARLEISYATTLPGSRDRNATPSEFLVEAGLIEKPAPKNRLRTIALTASDLETRAPVGGTGRSLAPSGTFAQPRAARTAPPPLPPRFLTVRSPRGRTIGEGTDLSRVLQMVGTIRRELDERGVSPERIDVLYPKDDPEATLPLQVALGLEGIRWRMPEGDAIGDSPLMHALLQAWFHGAEDVREKRDQMVAAAIGRLVGRASGSDDPAVWVHWLTPLLEDASSGQATDGIAFEPH